MSRVSTKIFLLTLLISILFGNTGISQTRIAILYSSYTEKISEKKASEVIDQITFLEIFLMQNKIPYNVIYDDEIETGIENDFDILILPSVEFLDKDQMNAIKNFLSNGKSVLSLKSMAGLVSSEDYSSNTDGESIFNFDFYVIDASASNVLQYLDYNYLTKFDPNFDNKILLTAKNILGAVDVKSDKIFPIGNLAGEGILNDFSSIFCGKSGAGKFVWFGFNQNDIIGGTEDINEYKNLLLNSLRWLDIIPDVDVNYFPSNYQSSTLILVELNNSLEIELIEKLHSEGYKPQLVFNLNQNISEDIKSKFNSEDFILDLSSLSNETEFQKIISDTLKYFSNQNGIMIENIILSKKNLSDSEKDFLKKSGIRTILFNSNYNGLPTILSEKLVAIPFSKTFTENNGIQFITFVPKINCDSNPEDEFLLQINNLKNKGSWFTTLSSFNEWWVIRKNLPIKLIQEENENLSLIITNNNPLDVNDISVFVDLSGNMDPGLITVKEGNQLLDYSIDNRTGLLRLNIETLKARQSKKIFITSN